MATVALTKQHSADPKLATAHSRVRWLLSTALLPLPMVSDYIDLIERNFALRWSHP